MKVGDLVRHKDQDNRLGFGLVTDTSAAHPPGPGNGYVWVAFQGWTENDKWCDVKRLEVISETE